MATEVGSRTRFTPHTQVSSYRRHLRAVGTRRGVLAAHRRGHFAGVPRVATDRAVAGRRAGKHRHVFRAVRKRHQRHHRLHGHPAEHPHVDDWQPQRTALAVQGGRLRPVSRHHHRQHRADAPRSRAAPGERARGRHEPRRIRDRDRRRLRRQRVDHAGRRRACHVHGDQHPQTPAVPSHPTDGLLHANRHAEQGQSCA